jgi:hypothetical protein
MPITPDDMPDMDDDNGGAQPNPARSNGKRRPAARMMNAGQNQADIDDDDAGIDDDAPEEDELEADAPQSFSELVRESPIGAVIGAFVVGFLVSRLI